MILVTGGLGFIGNELVRQLVHRDSVTILDNRNRIAPHIEDLGSVRVIEGDILDRELVCRVLQDMKPDAIIHLAAIHYIPECNAAPERTLRVNVEGTANILRQASLSGVKHFLYASSGAVYADSSEALSETSAVRPVDVYGYSKWFGEELCQWQGGACEIPVTICRLFNNIGPRETNPHIVPEIISQLKRGDILQLGNITTRRDYIHTSDTARFLMALLDRPPRGVRTVNVSSGESATVEELVKQMGKILGRKLLISRDESRFRKADKLVQVADISQLFEITGCRPLFCLEAALGQLLRFEGIQ